MGTDLSTQSAKYALNLTDLKVWGVNTITFSTPALLAALLALQGGMDWRIALGAGYSALIASLIGLLKKVEAGS